MRNELRVDPVLFETTGRVPTTVCMEEVGDKQVSSTLKEKISCMARMSRDAELRENTDGTFCTHSASEHARGKF
jgi:hypothetical protein